MFLGGLGGVILVFALVGVGLFLWLKSREDRRSRRGETRLATWRLLLASFFGLVALFSGGCSLLLLPDALKATQYFDINALLVIGGVPFVVALFLLWLLLRRGGAAGRV